MWFFISVSSSNDNDIKIMYFINVIKVDFWED